MSDDKKRVAIHCWNRPECGREYSLLATFAADQPLLLVACPFCGQEAEVDLAPYRSPVWNRYAGEGGEAYTLAALTQPDVLPSRARSAASASSAANEGEGGAPEDTPAVGSR